MFVANAIIYAVLAMDLETLNVHNVQIHYMCYHSMVHVHANTNIIMCTINMIVEVYKYSIRMCHRL